jgi:hypothetical protein
MQTDSKSCALLEDEITQHEPHRNLVGEATSRTKMRKELLGVRQSKPKNHHPDSILSWQPGAMGSLDLEMTGGNTIPLSLG